MAKKQPTALQLVAAAVGAATSRNHQAVDDRQDRGELAYAAIAMAQAGLSLSHGTPHGQVTTNITMFYWPHKFGTPVIPPDPVGNMVAACAFLVREIARLQRIQGN
jgi:hypothetical protein